MTTSNPHSSGLGSQRAQLATPGAPAVSPTGSEPGVGPSSALLWTVLAISMVAFVADYLLIRSGKVNSWDDETIVWMHDHSSAGVNRAMTWISVSGGFWRIVPMSLVVVFLLATRRRLEACVFTIAAVVAQLTRFGLTRLFPRERPALFAGAQAGDTSFPSGHAYGSTLVYGMIAYWLWQRGRRGPAIAVASWPVLVALSRVGLGAHHPTDVVASMCLGLGFLALTILVYTRLRHR